VIRQLRSELLKQFSTWTWLGLLAGMVALVLLVVLLHGFELPVQRVGARDAQQHLLFSWAALLGPLFGALLGAMAITSEFRTGTIRPTLLFGPRRGRMVAAKVVVSLVVGTGFGLLAAVAAAGAGAFALGYRGVAISLDSGDFVQLFAGCAASTALWAAIGVGLGGLIRSQVPTLVGICAWALFVDQLLLGDASLVGNLGRYTPGALAKAAIGLEPLVAPGTALAYLAIYAAVAATAGWLAVSRRDVG
jgi:ABC-type transport system involved in multi-copper enzyme maturation permease subunit